MTIFPVPDPITTDWLSETLQAAGVLPHGRVVEVQSRPYPAFNSRTSFLALQYSSGAPVDAPTGIVCKQNISTDWGAEIAETETRFYQIVAKLADHPQVVPRCYLAALDRLSESSCLLLQDLSASHVSPFAGLQRFGDLEVIPAAHHIDAIADTLALLHGYWWEHPLITSGEIGVGYGISNAERFAAHMDQITAAWRSLLDAEGDWLPAEIREIYEQTLDALPGLWERFIAPRFASNTHLTLIHGDCYFMNFLCPREAGIGRSYLLDWQSYSFDLGARALVNLCAVFWNREQRLEGGREERVLRRYHQGLRDAGVNGYEWADLMRDYQYSLILWLLVPLQHHLNGTPRIYWWPKMQRLADAMRDWGCEELLRKL